MASGGPPDTLNNRHLVIALLRAAGWTNVDIAKKLDMNANRIGIIAQSPLFRARVAELQREMKETAFVDLMTRLEREAGPTLDVILELRDHAENENVRLNASLALFDRQLPKVTRVEGENTLRISFGAPELRQMIEAIADDEGRTLPDVEHAALASFAPAEIRARTLDEAIEALEAAANGDT